MAACPHGAASMQGAGQGRRDTATSAACDKASHLQRAGVHVRPVPHFAVQRGARRRRPIYPVEAGDGKGVAHLVLRAGAGGFLFSAARSGALALGLRP